MTQRFRKPSGLKTALWFVSLGVLPSPAFALDLCVTCQGPDAHYNCRLDSSATNARDLRLQLLCITELAHGGGHASCAVDKAQQNPCPGATKVIAAPGDGMVPKAPAEAAVPAPSAVVPAAAPAPPAVKPQAAKPVAAPAADLDTPPKTVQDMVEKGAANTGKNLEAAGSTVKDAAKSTGNVFEKAGSAVGNAAKKTWHCLATLFGDC